MAAIPYAFSAHHFISSVGADAGFAAIIGLAILVLLFFSQARETSSLRQRAAESEEQVRRLAAYVDQMSRPGAGGAPSGATVTPPPRVVAQPRIAAARAGTGAPVASAPASGVAPAGVGARPLLPAAPAGVGAPALSAATRLIPVPDAESLAVHAAALEGAAVGTEAGAAVMTAPPPAPSTAAGGANGSGTGQASATGGPPPARVIGGAGAGRGSTSAGQPAPRVAIRRDDAQPTRPPTSARRAAGQDTRGSRLNRGVIAAAAVLVAAIAVAVVLVVSNSGGGTSPSSSSSAASANTASAPTSSGSHRAAAAAAVVPSTVTVSVLNGTATSNLAHDVSSKLLADRYKPGNIATASNQTQTATIVGYLPGFKRDALAVAKSLKLGPASVQAVNPSDKAVACSGQTTCTANVVVTVGSDLASDA